MKALAKRKSYHVLFLLFLTACVVFTSCLHFLLDAFYVQPAVLRRDRIEAPLEPKALEAKISALKPLWKCKDPKARMGRSEKVVFVHVYKTAGMSIRELLMRYALNCHAGIGLVSDCSGISNESSLGKSRHWVNGFGTKKGQPCRVRSINRAQEDMTLPHMHMEQSQLQDMDLLAGHLPLGVASAWTNSSRVQYITFFRSSIAKFVSGVMYQKKDQKYSFEDIVDLIHKRVRGELKQKRHREGYSAYLLTPQQKKLFYRTNSKSNTIEGRTQQVIENLSSDNIIFGIVERMSESLELIQYVIDADNEQTSLFENFGMTTHAAIQGNSTLIKKQKVNNPSKFSTASVIAALEEDPHFFAQLQEYVKYDQQIYHQALKFHTLQHQNVRQVRTQKSIKEVARTS